MGPGENRVVNVQLKGVHVVSVRLAGGKLRDYHYAWRGGPRLTGEPGSPEYIAAFNDAHLARKRPQTGTLKQAIVTYRASAFYQAKGAATLRDYERHLEKIRAEFSDAPFKDLQDPRFRGDAIDWRDTMAKTPREADYALGTFKRLLDHAKERGHITVNVLEGVKTLHRANRSDSIWTAEDIAAFNAVAGKELRWALALAIHAALRQGDLCRVTWGMYDGSSFTLRTGKTDKRVIIPATAACQKLLASIDKRATVILTPSKRHRGVYNPWTESGLRASFRKACEDAGVKRTFHDLRRTACTTLLAAGIDAPVVAMIMGWSEAEVQALQRLYVSRKAVVAAVIAQLERAQ
jgi:integrase